MEGDSVNTKVFVFDADGVVIRKTKVFSIRLSEKLDIPIEIVLQFMYGEFDMCLIGKADLKTEIAKYFENWGWRGSVEDIIKFWFEGESELDQEVLGIARQLKRNNIPVFLATNNESYRVDYLKNKLKLGKVFNRIFSSAEIGFKKPDREFYEVLLKEIGITDPKKVSFWDDDEKNVQGAKRVGLDAHLYKNIDGLRRKAEAYADKQ